VSYSNYDTVAHGPLRDIKLERAKQDVKWGEQNHLDGTGDPVDREMATLARQKCQAHDESDPDTWRDILAEEVYEAFAESDPVKLRTELVQAAAVCVAWIEAIDRRTETANA